MVELRPGPVREIGGCLPQLHSFRFVLSPRAPRPGRDELYIYLSAPPPAGDQSAGPGTTLSPQKSNSSSLPTFAIRHAIQANSARVGAGDSSRLVGSMCGHVSCVSSFSPLSINRAFSSSIVASKPRVITHQPFKHAHPTSRHHAARSGGPSPFNTSRSGIAALGYASLVDRDRDSSDRAANPTCWRLTEGSSSGHRFGAGMVFLLPAAFLTWLCCVAQSRVGFVLGFIPLLGQAVLMVVQVVLYYSV